VAGVLICAPSELSAFDRLSSADVKVKLKDFTDPKPVRIRAKSAQEVKDFYNFVCAMTEYLCQADGCKRLVPLETRHCERHKCTKKGCNGLAVFHNRCKKHNNER
jgi:hypothetical protein